MTAQIIDRQLYKVTADFNGLNAMLEDGTLTEGELADSLDAIGIEFDLKAIQIATLICNIGAPIPAIEEQIARLQARKKAAIDSQKWFKQYLMDNMRVLGKKKIRGDLFDVTLSKGRESVIVDDVDALTSGYVTVKTTTTADKRAIKKAFDAGNTVVGAHIETGSGSILIK